MEQQKEMEQQEYDFLDMYVYITYKAYDNNYIGYCYRERSDIKIDSGWRFLFGDEDESYLDNPDNSNTMYVREILQWKPELEPIIKAHYNSEFEWDEESKSFIKI